MNSILLARQTTTALILEALERFGPLAETEIRTLLDEPWQATGPMLTKLLLLGSVEVVRTADRRVVLFKAKGGR